MKQGKDLSISYVIERQPLIDAPASASVVLLESDVSLLNEVELDAASGEESDDWLLAFANDEYVVGSGGECVAGGVLHVGDVEATGVLLNVLEHTHSSYVVTTDEQNLSSVFVLDEAFNFTSLKVEL